MIYLAATQVISCFNYINRIADSLGVEQEEFIRPWEKSHRAIWDV